ncbi:glycosyltransferase family 2 protein [Anabaena sp. UHCC 0451]|uniref:glycosyltransferase family 2 protein n=1 Tax=Anabaena sp. UHCC 0451 TaxID=2055235 RepID=UPI002B21152B|nr:glycosyltransferase [Anabaena sp. UHCC 0451]MEA5575536.1 glycosyltransferase [Anabaena sp. UHCC 0451]
MEKILEYQTDCHLHLSSSVIIPSFQRPDKLTRCLQSLAHQTVLPNEVIVVWQAEDMITRDAVAQLQSTLPYALKLLHCPEAGVVTAENTALAAATGEIILLCDDDVVTPTGWVARHLSFYADPSIGAVGGSANNHHLDGTVFLKRNIQPIGQLTWYGKTYGNMYDQTEEWIDLSPIKVDHLVGYNLSIRRAAFNCFESSFKPYWQMFELDVCLQVKQRGYQILFDFQNVVDHYPTNTAYVGGRDGDLEIKIFNAGYNHALVLAKHSPISLYIPRLIYLLLVGSLGSPGFLASLLAIKRYGNLQRELQILVKSLRYKIAGWQKGLELKN